MKLFFTSILTFAMLNTLTQTGATTIRVEKTTNEISYSAALRGAWNLMDSNEKYDHIIWFNQDSTFTATTGIPTEDYLKGNWLIESDTLYLNFKTPAVKREIYKVIKKTESKVLLYPIYSKLYDFKNSSILILIKQQID